MHAVLTRIVGRVLWLAVTLCAGLLVLGLSPAAHLSGGKTPLSLPQEVSSMPSSSVLLFDRAPAINLAGTGESGYGAGDTLTSAETLENGQRTTSCSPLDTPCLAQAALSAILAPMVQNLTTFCDTLLTNVASALMSVGQGQGHGAAPLSFNFLTQTPLCFSTLYSACAPSALDGAIAPFTHWAQTVAASALALLLVIGGIGISLGQQAGWRVQGVAELLPRLVLTFLAAGLAPSIVQVAIDLNNLLCQGALQVAHIETLASQVGNLTNSTGTSNLLVLLFLLAATVMAILLIGQMGLRLAFVALLGALAPLGLFCFGLPLTSGWGRLWMQQFSLAVFVQFVQVAALALGGALLIALSAPTTALFANVQDATPIVESILLVMLLYLALRIPTMLSTYATPHVTREVSAATMETLEGVGALLSMLL
jgi:hypothetical protein